VVPQFAADEQYNYDPAGRRDPFKPYKAFKPQPTAGAPTLSKGGPDAMDPLQRWDLNRFTVVAIMWEIRNPRAMVKDPDGKMFMIGKNTKIGRNSGQVVAIREGEVLVVEQIDNEGVLTREVKILELKK
jgi:type IV pilus assembly protein PilP